MSTDKNQIKLDKELNLSSDFKPASYEEWKSMAEANLKGKPFEKALVTRTYEDIDLQPIYTAKDIENLPHLEGKPGFANYARGTKSDGYLANPWEISQATFEQLPETFNKSLARDLERGQSAIQLKLDTAARKGLDPDQAEPGDVGKDGVSISNLDDLETALQNVDTGKYPIHIDAGFSGLETLSALVALLKKHNRPMDTVTGCIDTDPLGYMATQGKLPIAIERAYDNMARAAQWSANCTPDMDTIGISGIHYHNAGASAVQELAFSLATAVEYMDALTERHVSVDDIAGQMRFTFAVGPFMFMEIAKIRAARILWAKIVEAYGGNNESRKMTTHGVTSTYNQTMYDPYVNMLRTTTETFSAVVAGVDSLETNPFDSLFGQPDEFSTRQARNTQLLLKDESHLDQLIDPAGGSYFVEKLTHDVAEKAWELFQQIQSKGGMLKALKENFPQTEIANVAAKRRKDLAKRKAQMVGTNFSANITEKKLETKTPDYAKLHKDRSEYIINYRKGINAENKNKIKESLSQFSNPGLEDAVKAGAEAMLAGATLGDLCAVSRGGESPVIDTVNLHRAADIFENLRDAVEAYEKKTGAKPKLFLANMGPVKQHKARADFSRGFFEVGGFDVVYPDGFDTPDAAVKAALESKAPVVTICSTDDTYPELVPPVVKGLKDKNADILVILAGYPKDQVDAHKEAGVDDFIFMGANAHDILSGLLTKTGVLA